VTSKISSSRRIISWLTPALRVIVSSAGAVAARDASLASVSDNPAAPKAGIVLLRRFLFDARFTALTALAAYQRWLGDFAPQALNGASSVLFAQPRDAVGMSASGGHAMFSFGNYGSITAQGTVATSLHRLREYPVLAMSPQKIRKGNQQEKIHSPRFEHSHSIVSPVHLHC
jgi:hypothetical protein